MAIGTEAFKFPDMPRMLLGDLTILPKVDRHNEPVPGQWVLPGCKVVSSLQARQFAVRKGLYFNILERSE